MEPIKTAETEFTYGAPPGREEEIGGLPCSRVRHGEDRGVATIYSVWEPSDEERQAIAGGANIRLGILGEPIPPVSLVAVDLPRAE